MTLISHNYDMAKSKKAVKAEKPEEAPAIITPSPVEPATSATVKWLGNERTYSKDIHGEKFADLAKQFADQYPGAVIVVQ